jgi:hypothetical protein
MHIKFLSCQSDISVTTLMPSYSLLRETLNAAVRRVCEADGAITIPDRFDK